jgi:biofilm protein TabA
MIIETLAHASRLAGLHAGFGAAFEFLTTADLARLEPGRHDLDGDRLFVLINHAAGRGEDAARLEAHRRYIDIQFTIDGDELIGWMPVPRCTAPVGAFDEGKDIIFFDDRPSTFVAVPPGSFTIFYPHDAHAPLAGSGAIKKAVVKVAVDW